MLDIIDVSKTFAPGTVNEHIALQNVLLHLDNGEFVTIVGSNGAGKSTLFNMLCGTYIQDKGKIILDDNARAQKSKIYRQSLSGPDEGYRSSYDY